MWIAVVAFLALLALCFFAYCRYECWLAKKLNPYVVAYQSDHDLEKLKQGLDHWRPWALSRHSQNIITANWFSALLEQKHWAEAEETLEQFLHRAKNKQDKMGYHLLRTDYARAIGDTGLEEQERLLSQQLKNQLGNKRENQEYLQTPKRVNMLLLLAFLQFWSGTVGNHQQYSCRRFNSWIGWSRTFYFKPVFVSGQLNLDVSLVDPAKKGGC